MSYLSHFFSPSVPVSPHPHVLSILRSLLRIRSVVLTVTYIRWLFQYIV